MQYFSMFNWQRDFSKKAFSKWRGFVPVKAVVKSDPGHCVNVFQELEMRNVELERRVQNSEQTLSSALEDREHAENEVQRVVQILDVKIFDLNDLRQSLVKLISK